MPSRMKAQKTNTVNIASASSIQDGEDKADKKLYGTGGTVRTFPQPDASTLRVLDILLILVFRQALIPFLKQTRDETKKAASSQ